MLTKQTAILIPVIGSNHQICDFIFQTAKSLFNHKNNVYIVNFNSALSLREILSSTIRKKKLKFLFSESGIKFVVPIYLIPFRRFTIINNLNQLIYFFILQCILIFKYGIKYNFICWMFFPQNYFLLFLTLKPWLIVYDIVDFYTLFSLKENKIIKQQKKYLLQRANYIFSISKTLKSEYQKLTKKDIVVSPQGFDYDTFSQEQFSGSNLIKKQGNSVLGFVGQLDERLDFDLLNSIISNQPTWQFIFIGPKKYQNIISNKKVKSNIDNLLSYKNVTWVKKVAKRQIPSLIKQFDVCIIPYDSKLKFNFYSYPMKLFEYFYLQKPVVSTVLKELSNQKFNKLIFVSNDARLWIQQIKVLLTNPWLERYKNKQIKLAVNNSWDKKIEFISHHVFTREE